MASQAGLRTERMLPCDGPPSPSLPRRRHPPRNSPRYPFPPRPARGPCRCRPRSPPPARPRAPPAQKPQPPARSGLGRHRRAGAVTGLLQGPQRYRPAHAPGLPSRLCSAAGRTASQPVPPARPAGCWIRASRSGQPQPTPSPTGRSAYGLVLSEPEDSQGSLLTSDSDDRSLDGDLQPRLGGRSDVSPGRRQNR